DYRASLERAGRNVVEIADADPAGDPANGARRDKGAAYRAAQDATIAAMRAGADVIYQGTFFDGTWVGKADFLLRVDHAAGEEPSAFGPWHYEIADTKLARRVKASAILQVCLYVDLLTPIQGRRPEHLRIVLGGKGTPEERIRLDDVSAYYRRLRAGFEAAVGIAGAAPPPQHPPVGTYPEPVDHCDVCNWARVCTQRRRDDDHLSRVAFVSRGQREALVRDGIGTRGELAILPPAAPVAGIEERALGRLREQAALQVASDGAASPTFRRLPPERDPNSELLLARGLLALPAPSPGDLFLDLEGDPYAGEDGLDYLFGVLEPALAENDARYLAVPLPAGTAGRGAVVPRFHAFWSRDDAGGVSEAGERRAFEQLIDLIMERLDEDPDLHVYHYAPYEPTALGRIALRYGTREDEVDILKRRGVLIDLYHVVRQGLRVGVESYSIKKLEPLYGFSREGRLAKANESIVEFERWLGLGADGDVADRDAVLNDIALYNRDDVVSTLLLRDWLEAQRSELERETGVPLPRPPVPTGERSEEREEADATLRALIDRLTDGVPEDPVARAADPDGAARWLLAQLLGFHRREGKSAWWRFHELMHMNDTQLLAERDAIADLVPVGQPELRRNGNGTWTFRYAPQVHGLKEGWSYYDPNLAQAQAAASGTWDPYKAQAGKVRKIDEGDARLTLYRTASQAKLPLPTSLVPVETVDSKPLAATLRGIAEWVADHGIASPAPDYRAARYLLLRRTLPPAPGATALRRPGESDAEAATRLAQALDGHVLPVQGPPGTGKTTTGAEMIVALVRAGYRVGITANSHAVIGTLLDAVAAKAGG
ncbi:MAG: TM0106 family RecB-like putative nuclease, partial [Chloroflexota bacterium]